MAIESERFEQSLEKISPELADTLKLRFNQARSKLQDDIASPLIDPQFKKAFDTTVRNLEEVKKFVIEEAGKLGEDDQEKKNEIVAKYLELLDEIEESSEYLFISNLGKTVDDMGKTVDKLEPIDDQLTKETDSYQPSEEEINDVLRHVGGTDK